MRIARIFHYNSLLAIGHLLTQAMKDSPLLFYRFLSLLSFLFCPFPDQLVASKDEDEINRTSGGGRSVEKKMESIEKPITDPNRIAPPRGRISLIQEGYRLFFLLPGVENKEDGERQSISFSEYNKENDF